MSKEKPVEELIEKAVNFWDVKKVIHMLTDFKEIYELFNVDENEDWVRDVVGEEDLSNIRLIRMIYLLSKIADYHASDLVLFKMKFPRLWENMERQSKQSSQ